MQREAGTAPVHPSNLPVDGGRMWSDLRALASITEPDRPWTRRSFTPRFLEGRAWLERRFREAGLSTRLDAAGNLIGRREGRVPGAPAIMLGSHSDTVPSGGRFDGVAGVIAALEVARALAAAGTELDHPLEIVDFLAEEPSEYGLSCVGSRGMAGALDGGLLELTGPGGERLDAAIDRVGGNVAALAQARRDDVAAFLELHIEQGPVLEATGTDVGIVTAIVGITRLEIVFSGQAGHSGTTPMDRRQDAGVAGARAMVWLRDEARALAAAGDGYFVATVGIAEVRPGGANVVPGEMRLVVDLRGERRGTMEDFLARLGAEMARIAGEEGARVSVATLSDSLPAHCDATLRAALAASARSLGVSSLDMASGAGHDAAFLSRIAPAAMVFIPCREGRSHCPEEWTEPGQLAVGASVLLEAVRALDARLSRRDAPGGEEA